MADLKTLADHVRRLINERQSDGWDAHWMDVLRFALPHDTSFEKLSQGGLAAATAMLATGPRVRARTKDVYDLTSVWAIERLTNGLMTMKAPETTRWHDLAIDDPFGDDEASPDAVKWLDGTARHMFRVRNNPRTGFWVSLKSAVRSMCALGDGFIFINEHLGDNRVPWIYEFVPIGECYHSVDAQGNTLTFHRVRSLTAEQIVARWGVDKVGAAVKRAFDDAATRRKTFVVAHSVTPRAADMRAGRLGLLGAKLESTFFVMTGEGEVMLQEGGYWNMPYHRMSWTRTAEAYSEGPMALALAEVKSLNEMSRNELIAAQQAIRPPLAAYGENFSPIDLNAGAINRGYINGDGRLLVQPITTQTRPDFAQAIIASRRDSVREMLYLNLWQILVDRPEMTATEALLRAQEKGDLLGPIGISMNIGLSSMVDHEIAIMARKGMFESGRPLAVPDDIGDADIVPIYKAPLDRLRLVEEAIGAQRTVQGMLEVAGGAPQVMDKLDVDAYADILRSSFGAPLNLLIDTETVRAARDERKGMEDMAAAADMAQRGGTAAQAVGAGMQAMQGQAVGSAPAGMPQ